MIAVSAGGQLGKPMGGIGHNLEGFAWDEAELCESKISNEHAAPADGQHIGIANACTPPVASGHNGPEILQW